MRLLCRTAAVRDERLGISDQQKRGAKLIVVVEGPSAAGKTTWIARHRDDAAVIGEITPDQPAAGLESIEAVADYWAHVNAGRWAMAVEAEQQSKIVLCDTDPFKLHYARCLWRAGYATVSEWRAARDANRKLFVAQRLGIADLILVSIPDESILATRRLADSVQLAEPLRDWYQAVSQLDSTRVSWALPTGGLAFLDNSGSDAVIDWLLEADPSIRWQVMRDLQDIPESEWRDGQWAGGAFLPSGFEAREWQELGQPWTATAFSLSQLREFGLDPSSGWANRAVELIGTNSRWDHGGEPYWEGEVEECINGRIVADGAYFGVDVSSIVGRLLGERLDDGGWNCERINGSVRSSFATTINVLEGLLEYERATGGTAESQVARRSGEEYLLERSLFRRLRTGEPAGERFLSFAHPSRWHYDVLRALDYFLSAAALTGAAPDPRLGEAVDHVRSRRLEKGGWLLDWTPPGRVWFEVDDGASEPSRWVTLRAMRVLRWWDSTACRQSPDG